MGRLKLTAAIVAGILAGTSAPAQTLEPSPSARVAAVRFASQNGWTFPSTKIIVSTVFDRGVMHATPVSRVQGPANTEIARLLGEDVKAEWPSKYLDCPGGDRGPCWAKGDISVLEIGEMLNDAPHVSLRLYSPGAAPGEPAITRTAVINLERRGTGWLATSYSSGPTTVVRKKR